MCCGTDLGAFQLYNIPSDQCCEANQLKPAGTCAVEQGIIYSGAIPMYKST